MQFPGEEVIKGSAEIKAIFTGCVSGAGPADHEALDMEITAGTGKSLKCRVFTLDKYFIQKNHEFQGEAYIVHAPEWKILPAALKLGLAQVVFYFFEKEGDVHKVLIAYIHNSVLLRFPEYFNC
ncbi:MAG: hypothetical protein WC022_01950 [Parcubacteria group bacterium]